MTLVFDLLEPALVQTTADLVALDPAQIRQASLKLATTGSSARELETVVDLGQTTIAELTEFARAVQSEPAEIEIWYRGRRETISL